MTAMAKKTLVELGNEVASLRSQKQLSVGRKAITEAFKQSMLCSDAERELADGLYELGKLIARASESREKYVESGSSLDLLLDADIDEVAMINAFLLAMFGKAGE